VTEGVVQFPEVWNDIYTMNVFLEGYTDYEQTDIHITQPLTLSVLLMEIALPPSNPAVNEMTGLMTWDEPARDFEHYIIYIDGNQVGETTETMYDLAALNIFHNGFTDTAGVSALYSYNNESEIITSDFTCHWVSDVDKPFLSSEHTLSNIYPNPFNPETCISFDLTDDFHVLMEVYNLKGQRVATLINAEYKAGTHNITWNADNLSSGIYLLRCQTGSRLETRKIMLLK
jgi:hypothetical protein